MNTTVAIDEHGFARGFSYHDGALDGVLSDSIRRELHLAFRSTDGQQRVLSLLGVSICRVDGFREGNIIHHIRILSRQNTLAEPDVRQAIEQRLSIAPEALSATARIFWMEASFGAEVLALCNDVSISQPGSCLALIR